MHDGSLEPIDSMLTLGSTWSKKNMERINISDFSRIEIRGDVDVEVVKSDLHEVFMVAHGRLKNEMEVDREGSTLVIEREHFRWGRAGLA
ncbi:MAG: hypothetical protein GWN86_20565, partial [Desulfobacterales bacterium]|nr:hypothetical protein [Desulfobacterales bacterium]